MSPARSVSPSINVPQQSKHSGFTLMEILISLAITAGVVTGTVFLYRTFEEKFSTEEKRANAIKGVTIVSTLLKDEIENIGLNIPRLNTPIIYTQYSSSGDDLITFLRADEIAGASSSYHSFPPIPVATSYTPTGSTITVSRCVEIPDDAASDCGNGNYDTYLSLITTGDLLLVVSNGKQVLKRATGTPTANGSLRKNIGVADVSQSSDNVYKEGGIYFAPVRYQEYKEADELSVDLNHSDFCNVALANISPFKGFADASADQDANRFRSYVIKVRMVQIELNSSNELVKKHITQNQQTPSTEVMMEDAETFKVEYTAFLPASVRMKGSAFRTALLASEGLSGATGIYWNDVRLKQLWPKYSKTFDSNYWGTQQTTCSNLVDGTSYSAYWYQTPFCKSGGSVQDTGDGGAYCKTPFIKDVQFYLSSQHVAETGGAKELKISSVPANRKYYFGEQLDSNLLLALTFNASNTGTNQSLYAATPSYASFTAKTDLPIPKAKVFGDSGAYADLADNTKYIELSADESQAIDLANEFTTSVWVDFSKTFTGTADCNGDAACTSYQTDATNGGSHHIFSRVDGAAGAEIYLKGSTEGDNSGGAGSVLGKVYFRANQGTDPRVTTTDTGNVVYAEIPGGKVLTDGTTGTRWANLLITYKKTCVTTSGACVVFKIRGATATGNNYQKLGDPQLVAGYQPSVDLSDASAEIPIDSVTPISAGSTAKTYIGIRSAQAADSATSFRGALDEFKIMKKAPSSDYDSIQAGMQFDYDLKNDLPPYSALFADSIGSGADGGGAGGFVLVRNQDN